MPRPIEDPILAYTAAEGEVNQIQWVSSINSINFLGN